MLDFLPLSYYISAGCINFVTSFALSVFVFSRNPKSRINQTFSLFAFTVGGWGLCYFLWLTTGKSYLAEIYLRTLMLFVIFIPTTFTHFILILLKVDSAKKINLCNYVISTLLGFAAYTPLFAYDIGPFLVFPNWLKAGPLFYVHTIHFFANVIYSHYLMLQAIRRSGGIFRNQILYVLIGTAIGYSGGSLNYLTWMRFPIPPFLNLLVSVYVATVAYAIIRHRLMDIEVVIKKTLVFAGLLTFVFATYSAAAFIVREILGRYFGVADFWTNVISIFLIVLGYDPIRNKLINITDRFLFQKKQEFRIILNRLGENITQTLDLDEGAQIILSTLRESLRLESGAIVMKDENDNGYYILDSFNAKISRAYYESGSLLIKHLLGNKPVRKYGEHQAQFINLEDPAIKGKMPTVALARLEELNAAICFPLFIKEELIGFVTLGKKKSDEEFTQQEMGYFPSLVSQIATALSKARTHDILRKSQLEFIQREKMAALGTLSAGINHDIKNPLNNIKNAIEMHEMNDESGFFSKYSKEDYKNEIKKIFESVKEDAEKIDEIAKGLAEYVHQGDAEFKSQPVDLEKEIDGAYRLLKSQMQHNVIEFIKDFPQDIPKVSGDARRINEVLVNIINNGRQAIKQNGTIKIVARKKQDTVELSIIDNGPGMSDEIQRKIFDPFFTTKAQGEGTGMGLYICREIIKRMKAKISVKSEVGKGTTFTIEFLVAAAQEQQLSKA